MTPTTDTPMREGSRDGQGGCLVCGKDTPSARAKYCGRAHQQRSYRLRHQTPTADLTHVRTALQRRTALIAHTIYECGGCGERFVGVRRYEAWNLFCGAVGVGSFDIVEWPRLMLGNGPPVVRARPTLPTSNGRLEVGCAGEERRWICSRSYAANTSSG